MLGPRDIVSVSTLSALAVLAAPLPSAGQEANALSAVQRRVLDLADVTVGGRRFEVHAFDGHVHTEHSMDARLPTRQVLAVAEAVGLDTLIITDHGTTSADREVQAYGGPLSVLIGAEVGGDYGHALLWNLRNREGMAVAAESMPTLGAFARRHGALAVLAHPGWWFGHHPWDPRRWMHIDALRRGGISETVDALELWNGQYWHRTRELIDEWAALIEQGIFVPVVGSSDFHLLTRQRLGVPFNAFLCPVGADRAACLVEAVRGGRLYVSDGPSVTLDVDGRTFGETVRAARGALVPVRVRVLAPEGGLLELFLGAERVRSWRLEAGVVRELSDHVRVERDTGLRLQIRRTVSAPRSAGISLVTNPVLIDVGRRRLSWRGPDEGPVEAPGDSYYRRARPSRAQRAEAHVWREHRRTMMREARRAWRARRSSRGGTSSGSGR